MGRIDAVCIAIEKAREFQPQRLAGGDAGLRRLLPFPDGPQLAIDASIGAIVQPAGSVGDELVIATDARPESRWSRPACGTFGTDRSASRRRCL